MLVVLMVWKERDEKVEADAEEPLTVAPLFTPFEAFFPRMSDVLVIMLRQDW